MDTATNLAAGIDFKFWLLFEQAAVGMALISPNGRYLRANPELCRMLGYTEDQMRVLTFRDVTHPDDIAANDSIQNKLLVGEIATYRAETRYIRRDGSTVWAFLSVSLVRDDGGAPEQCIAVIQDITERKQVQDELERARSRYEAIYNNVEDFISVNDLRGDFIFASNSSAKLLGYSPTELLGTNIFRYIHPDDRDVVYEAYKKFSEGSNEHLRVRYRAFHKGGSYAWVETYARPFSSSSGAGVEREIVCVSHNVREQQVIQEKPAPAKQQAEPTIPAMQESGNTDKLTGLSTRQASDEVLGSKLVSRRSASFPFGVLLVDVDRFKEYNDTYGQEVGNEILRRVALALQTTCRTEDSVARHGGDEFMIALPNTNPGGTIILGEKLIRNVKAIDWSDTPVEGEVTLSIGATCITYGTSLTLPELMGIVDQQLAQAKESGGNRLIMNTRQTAQRLGRY